MYSCVGWSGGTGRGWRCQFPRFRGTSVTAGAHPAAATGEDGGQVFPGRGAGGSVDDAEYPKRGFDMQLAAGYQLWGGLLTLIVLPLVVLVAGLFWRRTSA